MKSKIFLHVLIMTHIRKKSRTTKNCLYLNVVHKKVNDMLFFLLKIRQKLSRFFPCALCRLKITKSKIIATCAQKAHYHVSFTTRTHFYHLIDDIGYAIDFSALSYFCLYATSGRLASCTLLLDLGVDDKNNISNYQAF